jgi:hypothetical protein
MHLFLMSGSQGRARQGPDCGTPEVYAPARVLLRTADRDYSTDGRVSKVPSGFDLWYNLCSVAPVVDDGVAQDSSFHIGDVSVQPY